MTAPLTDEELAAADLERDPAAPWSTTRFWDRAQAWWVSAEEARDLVDLVAAQRAREE